MARLDKIVEEAKELRDRLQVLEVRPVKEFSAGINYMDLHPDKNYADVGVSMGILKNGKTFSDAREYWDYVCAVLEDRRTTPGEKVRALFAFDLALQFGDPKYVAPGTPQNGVRKNVQKLLVEFVANANRPKPVLYVANAVADMNRRALEEIVFLDLDRVQELYRFVRGRQYAKGELCTFTLTGMKYVGTDVAAG